MGEIRFVGDAHLGHKLVSELRGFDTVEAHDQQILANMARVAQPDTIWWHTGDEAFNGWQGRIAAFAAIPGTHHLVLGNHDRAFPANSNSYKHVADYLTVFASVQFNPNLASAGRVRAASPNLIEVGPSAFASSEEMARTVAHELNHARSFLRGGAAPESTAYGAEGYLSEWMAGLR